MTEIAARVAPAMLLTWMNVDPAHETDFNQWYDREHIEERVRIPGFLSGARYINVGAGPRYLGLYRTSSLEVFSSANYLNAFRHQTAWSVANFGRMRDAMRRVCSIPFEIGAGIGAYLAVVRLGAAAMNNFALAASLRESLQKMSGIVSARLLIPDPALSTPLAAEDAEHRVLDPIVIIETACMSTATSAGRGVVERVAVKVVEPTVLRLLWQLRAADLHD